jgi:uncharacterized repeat protein (TIGR01451 family)
VNPFETNRGQTDAFVATITDTPVGSSDLGVTTTASPDPVTEETPLTYTVTVFNNGPDPATQTALIETLASEVTFVSSTSSQGVCQRAVGKTILCNLGDLPNLTSATVTIVVTPNRVAP